MKNYLNYGTSYKNFIDKWININGRSTNDTE